MSQHSNLSQPFPYQNAYSPNQVPSSATLNPGQPHGASVSPGNHQSLTNNYGPALNFNASSPLQMGGSSPMGISQNTSFTKRNVSPFPVDKQNGPYTGSPYLNVNPGQNMNGASPVNGFSPNQIQTPMWNSPRLPLMPGQTNQMGPPPGPAASTGGSFLQPGFPRSADDKTVSRESPSSAGLPMPYGPPTAASASPQITPGTSQPPSAKSSRNPSPISSQRYDYMEGQFSNKPSPSSSSHSLSGMGASPNMPGGLVPPPRSISGDAQQSPGMYQYSPSVIQAPPAPVKTPVTGHSARPPYPQQVGYNQSPARFPSPMPNQPSPQPSPMYDNSPYRAAAYNSGLPEGPVGGVTGYDPQLHAKMAGLSVHNSFSKLWGNDSVNLLQDRNILPALPIEAPKPVLSPDRPNCSPDIFRCTLTKVPDNSSLLQKSRLPFGILIHPFKDSMSLPVIQCTTIVRCRNCRTYINPFVTFVDQRRWKCNLCFRVNDLPEEFLYDPSSRAYGDPSRRPEIKNATVEFVAPADYMLRPPQPAVYLFLLDVSHAAIETGYLQSFCDIMLKNIDELPGDTRTRIGFVTFDGSIHFYNLGEGLNQPHMLVVSDIEDVFLPSPDNLLANLQENKPLIADLLNDLPKRFATNGDVNSCLGAALQVAYKLMNPVGGRVTVIQSCLPNYGPGALKNREDPNQRAGKDISNLGPVNDFYKKLALDCSGQQIAVDLFLLCSQYVDIATVSCISKYSSGCVHYYPGFHQQLGQIQVEKFEGDFKRYLTRRIGFEAVMRIRCTRGLAIHTFHGNFFVRSTDLLSLPNVNPDTGYGMQIAIEENLSEYNTVCFQAAVLYTSSNGERRIRVHTLCLPVVSILADVLGGADQETVIGLIAKMAVDRSISSLSDARDALINVCLDVLGVYKSTMSGQVAGALMAPYSARLLPLFILALLKHVAFRTGVSTKLDERVFSMEKLKALPLKFLMKYIYPTLYPVHALDEKNAIHQDDDSIIPQPVILQLSSERLDRHGAYILDTLDVLYLYVGRAINDHFCTSVLNVPNFNAIPEGMTSLPDLPTAESERMRSFVQWLQEQRPYHSPLKIIREDSRDRFLFLQYMLDDRSESLFSYYEFLQHIRQQISK